MPYYHFRQNNTGGYYAPDTTHHIIIKADTADEANRIAVERTPIYFDGVANGLDCQCCGDRWYAQWDDDEGASEPLIYGRTIHPDGYIMSYGQREDILIYEGGL
jgi:hypothetical protein